MSRFVIKTIGSALNATSFISSKYASNKALNLFASPRKGRYTETQRKVVSSAIYEELKYDNLNIATYRWHGKNKTVLLAHGWESNASRWAYLLEVFRDNDYDVIALDAPAHGRSDGNQFNAILYSEFINVAVRRFSPEVVVGHSVGGMASVFCKNNHEVPSIQKLILLGAPAHFTGVFSRYKSMMGYNRKISEGLDRIVLERFGKSVDYFSAANFTANFDIKGLIVHDKKDRIIPYEDALLFANRYKSAKLISTSGFGHSLKDPSITPKLLDFINE